MKHNTLLSLINQAVDNIVTSRLIDVIDVANGIFIKLPLDTQIQIESNAKMLFTDNSVDLPELLTPITVVSYGTLAITFILFAERKVFSEHTVFPVAKNWNSFVNNTQGRELSELLLMNVNLHTPLRYHVLCRMSVHTSNTDTDAAVIFSLDDRNQFQEALLAGSQSFMNTDGYDEGFVCCSFDYRIQPESITEITESDVQCLTKLLTLRHWDSLSACGYDIDVVRAVMEQEF